MQKPDTKSVPDPAPERSASEPVAPRGAIMPIPLRAPASAPEPRLLVASFAVTVVTAVPEVLVASVTVDSLVPSSWKKSHRSTRLSTPLLGIAARSG